MSKIYEFINNGKIMQLKDGYMRIVTPTERDSHEFELSDIIGVNNFEENLPAVFELIKRVILYHINPMLSTSRN